MIKREVSRTDHVINYLITYFAIAFSGIPFFDSNATWRLYFLVILALLFFLKGRRFSHVFWLVVLIILALLFVQKIAFGAGSYFTFATFTGLTLFTPYFLIKIVGTRLLHYLRNTIYFIAIVSLGFWLATNLVPGFFDLTYNIAGRLMPYSNWEIQESLILYTVEFAEIYGMNRNPGPFHEPGAFAVFITLGMVLELLASGKLFSRRNIVFIVCMLTTFSTAGYLALFVIFSFYFLTNKRMNLGQKVLSFIIVFPLIIYLFVNLEFMNEKLSYQSSQQMGASLNSQTSGRFLGARKALVVLQRYPLYGRGLLAATKAETTSEEAAGYGWINWVSKIGILFGILYLFFIYKTIQHISFANNQSKLLSYFLFIAVLAALAGQKHTSSIVFFSLFLMSIEYSPKVYSYGIYRLVRTEKKLQFQNQ